MSALETSIPHSGHTFLKNSLDGQPQLGHFAALSETCFPHSGHVISAIASLIVAPDGSIGAVIKL